MNPVVSVDLQVVSDADDVPCEKQIHRWARSAIQAATAGDDDEFELAVRLVDENEIQALNARYRQRDKPTNVLSFPFEGLDGLPEGAVRLLGDLVICAPIVHREAGEQGKKPQDHWAHMVVHGILHLLGHEHEEDERAAAMMALETKILQDLGIENPYRDG